MLLAAGPGGMRLGIDVERQRIAGLAPSGAGAEFAAVGHHDIDDVIVGVKILFHDWTLKECRQRRSIAAASVSGASSTGPNKATQARPAALTTARSRVIVW